MRASINGGLTNGPGLRELTYATNPYQYGNLSPVTWSDPSGDNAVKAFVQAIGIQGSRALTALGRINQSTNRAMIADPVMTSVGIGDGAQALYENPSLAAVGLAAENVALKGTGKVLSKAFQQADKLIDHARDGHADDFANIGHDTRSKARDYVADVIERGQSGGLPSKSARGGRTGYFDPKTGFVVVTDPKSRSGGSAFIPNPNDNAQGYGPREYFDNKVN